jgi:hypothetical protein
MDSIDDRFIVEKLARDLGQTSFNPYPLPFEDSLPSLLFGYLSTDSTICRYRTRSAEVVVGPLPGASVNSMKMWVMLGPGEVALPVPVWVCAESVPELLNGSRRAELCDKALSIHECLHDWPGHSYAINSFRLAEMYDSFAPVESTVFAVVESCESAWGPAGPDPAQACSVTAVVSRMVMGTYRTFEHYTHWGPVPKPEKPGSSDTQSGVGATTRRDARSATVFDAVGRVVRGPNLRPGAYFVISRDGVEPARITVIR